MSQSPDIDLGHGHTGSWLYQPYDGHLFGMVVSHECVDGTFVGTAVFEDSSHSVLSMDPPTIAPSLWCQECGDHGWIQQGKWVPAS